MGVVRETYSSRVLLVIVSDGTIRDKFAAAAAAR